VIRTYVLDIATEMKLPLLTVSVIEAKSVCGLDIYILCLSTEDKHVNALVQQSDVDNFIYGNCCDRLELRVCASLSRLKMGNRGEHQGTQGVATLIDQITA
jgi:hypothetical protein